MKRSFFFILSSLIIVSCNRLITNDWQKDDLQGRVKHITTTTGEALQHGDSLSFGKYTYTEEVFYDSKGLKTHATTTDENGLLNLQCVYEHDRQGNMIAADIRDIENKPVMRNLFEYNSQGHMTKMSSVDPDGHTDLIVVYENDSSGNKIKETVYDHLGRVVYAQEADSVYDKQTENAHYQYDSQGNWTRKITYQTDTDNIEYPTFLWIREIEYY